MRKCLRWLRARVKLLTCLALVVFLLLNVFAYLHAHALTHFIAAGARTPPPERLSFFSKCGVLLSGVSIPRPENGITPDRVGLSFTTHRITVDDAVEIEGWYVPHARANAVVVLFHGYAASKSSLLQEARAFHDLGYATFLIDFRGSDGSSGAITTIGYAEAEDVAAAVIYARSHWPSHSLILYGQSMGGAAVPRAVAHLDVKADALVLECPFDRLLSTVQNRFRAMGVPGFPSARLIVFWGAWQLGFPGFAHNPAEYAENVACPVLLMHGEDDPRVTPAQAQSIFEHLPGPKTFERFKNAGHEALFAANADQWRRAVSRFFTDLR